MFPACACNNTTNGVLSNTIFFSKCSCTSWFYWLAWFALFVFGSNLSNHFIGQLGLGLTFAFGCRSVGNGVGIILFWRSPLKIFKAIVGWIAVGEMASLMLWRTRTNKSFKNEAMHLPGNSCTQKHMKITSSFVELWFETMPYSSSFGPNTSIGPCTIKWVPWNLAIFNGRLFSRHARLLGVSVV